MSAQILTILRHKQRKKFRLKLCYTSDKKFMLYKKERKNKKQRRKRKHVDMTWKDTGPVNLELFMRDYERAEKGEDREWVVKKPLTEEGRKIIELGLFIDKL